MKSFALRHVLENHVLVPSAETLALVSEVSKRNGKEQLYELKNLEGKRVRLSRLSAETAENQNKYHAKWQTGYVWIPVSCGGRR